MLSYGIKSLKAVSKFFSYRNDVNIYTEDKVADKEFYRTVFNRLFGNDVTINDVTPLGCKTNVLNAFDNRNRQINKKEFFIVDGDLDLIIDNNRKEEDGLIILDSYCIENYLIEEQGIIEFLYFSHGSKDRIEIKNLLEFEIWLNNNANSLLKLFLNLAILKKYQGGPKLKNANEFLKQVNKETVLDTLAIDNYSENVRNEIISILVLSGKSRKDSEDNYEVDFNLLKSKWKFDSSTLLRIVSGKSYLLPLLQFKINNCLSRNKLFPNNALKLFLAANFELDRLQFLKEKIIK